MRKRSCALILSCITIAAVLLFFQCNNYTTLPSAGNQGYVTVSFSAEKTAISPAEMEFDNYEFIFYRASNNSTTTFYKEKDESFIFMLDLGIDYILEVKAYRKNNAENNLAAKGLSGSFTVDADTAVQIMLNTLSSGGPKGTFSYCIEYPEEAEIEELILKIDDDNAMDLMPGANTEAGKISHSVDLETGWYFLILRLSMNGEKAGYANGVEIFSGQPTCYGTILEPVVFKITDFSGTPVKKSKYIALTYDDAGPEEWEDTTRSCLDILKAEDIKATFFIWGEIGVKVEPLIQRMYDEGHEIGNHTKSHRNWYTHDLLKDEIEETDEAIGRILAIPDYKTEYFRPPHDNLFDLQGNPVVEEVTRELGKGVILWDYSTYDYVPGITVPDIYEIIVSCAASETNEIILMHTQNYQSVVAVYFAAVYLKNQGYEFLTVSEFLEREGITLEPGQIVGAKKN